MASERLEFLFYIQLATVQLWPQCMEDMERFNTREVVVSLLHREQREWGKHTKKPRDHIVSIRESKVLIQTLQSQIALSSRKARN